MVHQQHGVAQLTFIRLIRFGAGALALLFAVYYGVANLVFGIDFVIEQFANFWYFIVSLALGFGMQAGLYIYLKNLAVQCGVSGKVVAVSGATSTAGLA